jgi:thioredoxin 1
MNPRLLIFLVLIIIVVSGIAIRTKSPPLDQTPSQSLSIQPENATISPQVLEGESRYVPYNQENFDRAQGKQRVLYFHAPWCPTCRPADQEFQEQMGAIPPDVVLFKTDYDSSTALKRQYAITYQHTFVLVDEAGKEIKKWNGGGIDELIANSSL